MGTHVSIENRFSQLQGLLLMKKTGTDWRWPVGMAAPVQVVHRGIAK